MIPLKVDTFVFHSDSPPTDNNFVLGLKTTAKRYTTVQSAQSPEGLTLLFTHCVGAHKEHWEPTIQRLFHAQQCKDGNHRIREAWSFDRQDHGDAALLNREALSDRPEGVSVFEWASAITSFLRSPHIKGHRLIAIGQSAGAGTAMLLAKEFPTSHISFVALILVEPTMLTRELFNANIDDRLAGIESAVSATSARRDTWESREAAFHWFRKRLPWKVWDPRIVRILSEYGLRDTAAGVTLKCSKEQEAIAYRDTEPQFEATDLLGRVSSTLPVHIIWGTKNDLMSESLQDALAEGRMIASITKVQDAGHMIVQEQPDRLADAMCQILDSVQVRHLFRSRL